MPSFSVTYRLSTFTSTSGWSPPALKDISDSSRSIMVCSRRAPMFSADAFSSSAISAIFSSASGANSSFTPSTASSCAYCLVIAASVCDSIRTKSSLVSDCSVTVMGNRP